MTNEQVLQQIRHLAGSRYVVSVKRYITELTGRMQVIGPRDLMSRELNPERIVIRVNKAGNIESFSFG
ncbi:MULTISPECIES: I78 family peptidase inhibitor [Pseudomonas]|jgi:hypothetical protein|uniref:Peptidase inhibitor I78 family protein n=1 Tax=Pseudomonas fluorescens TaxID=294 RepID=A0AAE2DM09_PSEFL|nr:MULTISPECIES: I78 family peptidase inhibitor [Pseudomonas]KIF64264.1 hypothetical protein QS95_02380 [Pseudomonas fluorescens]MBP3999506.1 hypothetical protein [Pseudomonas koreensis]POA38099.1 hypothetical protein C1891_09840 [Pseudomonas sp. GW456-12-1-14-TSB6]QIA00577.1 hypothetical protein GZH78_00155 [Pseudomonas fluorescens]TFA83003.1 peptidase inhibitor I78 family protein [Pseudomonas sp. LAIL14HWK12:I2]